MPRALGAAVVVLLALLMSAPLARADGDPASDYLLTRPTFVPPDLGLSSKDAARLADTVALAQARGYPIRVALIGTPYDLGSVSSLDRKPKQYARFLGEELTLVYHGRLLVVMRNGFGVSRGGKALVAEQRRLDRLPPPGAGGSQLLEAGIAGVRNLAAGAGVSLPPPAPAGSAGSSHVLLWAAAAGAVVLLLGGALVAVRRRRG